MAERDLDRYLEGLGIDVDGERRGAAAGRRDRAADGDLIAEEGHRAGADPDDEGERDRAEAEDGGEGRQDGAIPRRRRGSGPRARTRDAGPRRRRDRLRARARRGGLGGVVPDDLAADQRAETFIVQLLLYLDPTYAVDVTIDHDGTVHIDVHGGDAGRLIGKGGRTLAALEFLTNAVVNKVEGEPPVRVNVDVGGYKRRRDERLRIVAQRAAARVRKSGMAVELEPMSAAERRVVHMELADDPAVESESTGEGRDRRVVVYPVGDGA
jgi:spoIIIJ-associated protein